ncbi:TPA: hypothetical protein ACH3X1_016234 [Trebouxia sp. C0004]
MDDIIAFKEHFAPFDSPMSAGETADRWWQRVSSRKPKMALAKLARMVLSVVPHAAEPEKSFSFMGLVHDPLRNRFRLSLGFKTKVKQPQQKKKRTVDAADSGPVDITTTKANMTYNPLPPHSGQVEAQNESEPQDPEPQEVDEWVQFLTQVYENDKGDAEI